MLEGIGHIRMFPEWRLDFRKKEPAGSEASRRVLAGGPAMELKSGFWSGRLTSCDGEHDRFCAEVVKSMPNGLTIATFSRLLALVNYHRKIVLPCYYS